MAKISKNIRRLRNERGLTQEALAEKLNVTRQTVSSWETDRTRPDIDLLEAISAALNADIEELADEYEYAYFLGYVYRYECLLHDESSRMVYGAFPEKILRNAYDRLAFDGLLDSMALSTSVSEICRQLDASLVERLTDDKKE